MRVALPLSFLALVLVGCAPQPQRVGGTPRQGAPPKVVSLSPSATEVVASTMNSSPLVGRTSSDNYPANVASVPVVAETKPDFEAIQKAKPDIVVYDGDLFNEADIKRIEGMGAKSFGFKDHTVEGFEKELFTLSGLLGSETNVNDYVTRIERERNAAQAEGLATKPKVAVVMGKYVAGTDSFLADVVRIAGGEPVGPPTGKFDAMSPEALVSAAPDIIVLPTTKETGAKDLAALRADSALAATPAIKAGRIVPLMQDVVLRRGARVDQLIRDLHRGLVRATQARK